MVPGPGRVPPAEYGRRARGLTRSLDACHDVQTVTGAAGGRATQDDLAIDDFTRAHATCVEILRGALDGDWRRPAGSLVWSAAQTAAHLTDVLFSYAFQAAAHGTRGVLPFEELHAGPGADAEGLVDGIHASGRMLISVLRNMPDGVTSPWFGRGVAPGEWAAMGTRETLLHGYDIAVGLGVELTPPRDVAARAYEQWHLRRRFESGGSDDGDRAEPDDPWAALVRASERPFGDGEWEAWRTETAARRARPAPAGSEAGVLGDFADGTLDAPFGPGWRAFTDERLGGRSTGTIEVAPGGPPGLAHSLRVEGSIEATEAALNMAGATFLAADRDTVTANLSAWRGVRFWARGAERPFAVWSLTADAWGGRHVIPLTDEWMPHRLPFSWFGTDGSDLRGLLFAVDSAPGEFWFQLGDVRLF